MRDAKVGAFLASFCILCIGAYAGFLALESILHGNRQAWNWVILSLGIWLGCGAAYFAWKFLQWVWVAPWIEISRNVFAALLLVLSYWFLVYWLPFHLRK